MPCLSGGGLTICVPPRCLVCDRRTRFLVQLMSELLSAAGLKCVAERERDEARAERDRDLAAGRRFQQLYMEADHARREAEAKLARIVELVDPWPPKSASAVIDVLAIAKGER